MADFWSKEFAGPIALKVGGYSKLTKALTWTPGRGTDSDPVDGEYTLYAKIRARLKPGYLAGSIRREDVRAAFGGQVEDPTGYQDVTVLRPNCPVFFVSKAGALTPNLALATVSAEFDWLVQASWVGELTKGRALDWRIKLGPEFFDGRVLTHYAKGYYRGAAK